MALDPIVKFRRDKIYEHATIREFYSLLRAAMIGARRVWLLPKLINKQSFLGIMAWMPLRIKCSGPRRGSNGSTRIGNMKWNDSLNMAVTEPTFMEYSRTARRLQQRA
jgi:hypothetical protein